MPQLASVLLVLCVLASCEWLWIFWLTWRSIRKWPPIRPLSGDAIERDDDTPEVTVFIPARNEARHLEQALSSVLAQDYPRLCIRFIDDQSTDETFAIAQKLAKEHSRLELFQGQSRPAGWLGKPWALHQITRSATGDWFLFVDADVVLHPQTVSRALDAAQRYRTDLLSLAIGLNLASFWQRIIGMASVPILSAAAPFAHVNDPKKSVAFAAGGFMLFRRQAYEAVGGHAAVKDRIIEDVVLAQRIKRRKLRLLILPATELLATHFFGSLREIWSGLSKNLYALLDFRPVRLFACTLLVSLWAWIPWIGLTVSMLATTNGWPGAWYLVLLGSVPGVACMILLSNAVALETASPAAYALSFPLGATLLLAITWTSACRFHFGSGLRWKERSITPPSDPST